MSEEKHGAFLRSLPHVYELPQAIKDSIYAAADYIDELEGANRLLNKLGNLESGTDTTERLRLLEDRVGRMVSSMDLEQAIMQMRQEFSRIK